MLQPIDAHPRLADFVAPLAPTEFVAHHVNEDRWLVRRPGTQLVERFLRIPELADLSALVDAYRSPVMAVGMLMTDHTEGLSDRALVTPDAALGFYRRGAALELDCAEAFFPGLRSAIDRFRHELGLPAGTFGKGIVYAASRGAGFAPHMDAYVNFVFQIAGRKTWYLHANASTARPVEHYDLSEYPRLGEELRSYWQAPPPEHFFETAERVVLEPGSLLFLPRGAWHATRSDEPTLSVNITFSIPTWLDLALSALRARLVRLEPWRRFALTGTPGGGANGAARAQVAALLAQLDDALAGLDADDVLVRDAVPHDVFQESAAIFRQLLKL